MPSLTEPDLTEDRLLGGRVRFWQPRHGYRAAIDPVLLAAAVAPEPGAAVLDAGTGSGAAALCLAARVSGCRIVGLERDPELLAVAARNFAADRYPDRLQLVTGDLFAPPAAITAMQFDQVLTNPPFHMSGSATPPRTLTGRAAHLAERDLPSWIAACLARLRPRGWLTLIHRADQLDVILTALAGRAGDAIVCPLWPDATAGTAKRVIVAARKTGRGPLRLGRGLVLHEADGRFTAAAEAILRDGASLQL
jgi:tRNA1(Val) A37 N6-methylase TrmN6